ncbi:MAG: ATP-binding cassette domain-containing protein, partial [Marinilabiliaceae bacterium]|nr:ATP-binding cassette domain-containing protein [Marinilabiliaceae bacterium]
KFNMNAKSGTLVAVMGGSGVGKSTLINVLNGTLTPNKGEVFFNGHNLNKQDERTRLKGVIGLVPQEDLLIEDLTVYQNLYYSAKLCLDGITEDEIAGTIDKVLDELDLIEIKNLNVGSPLQKVISGGQRKRLNIALELIREPHVLFIDEPTSGLSSLDAENVMNLIKEQADNGKLVIVNIHQPSSYLYKMFDKVLILDKGGYQIFYGNPMEAIVYFKRMTNHANPSEDQCAECGNVNTDQLLQIIDAKVVNEHGKLTNTRKVSPEEWSKLFEKNIKIEHEVAKSNIEIPHSRFKIPGKIRQTFLYFKRDLVSKLANRQYVIISLIEAPLLAFILGYFTKYIDVTEAGTGKYIFYLNENIPAYLFMSIIVSLFLGLIGSAEEIIKDRKILKREVFLNLSRASYLNSKVIVLFILAAIQTLSFVIVGNVILEIKGMTLSYWLILFSTSCFAILMGLNISSGFDKVITVYILIPFLLIPQLLLSGVIVNFDKLHKSFTNFDNVPVIGDMMTSRWAYEALAVHQFRDNEFQKLTYEQDMRSSQNNFYCIFLIPELNKKTIKCEKAIGVEKWSDHFQQNLAKLSRYVTFLSEVSGAGNEHIINNLNKESFDTITAGLLYNYLDELKKLFRSEANKADAQRDSIINHLDSLNGTGYTSRLKDIYHNKNLEDFLLRRDDPHKIIETNKRLIQKLDPAYRIPLSRTGRAHFYAPVKRLGNLSIDTYWFNLGVIWLFTLLLYITLYYDSLRKGLNYFQKPVKT